MASGRQMQANRLNALKSTGPRSIDGKSHSSKNALTHGLTSAAALLPGEDASDFDRFCCGIVDDLNTVGELERELAYRIAGLLWRLRRFDGLETALFRWYRHYLAKQYDKHIAVKFGPHSLTKLADSDPNEFGQLETGRVMDAVLTGDLLGKLTTYSSALHRQCNSLLKQFFEVQNRRLKQPRVLDQSAK